MRPDYGCRMTTITTQSGRTQPLPQHVDATIVVGLDDEGRIVVDQFGALTSKVPADAPRSEQPHLFGLTLCCHAWDTATEDGVVCRSCYDEVDTGHYIFRVEGTFPGLDPVASIA